MMEKLKKFVCGQERSDTKCPYCGKVLHQIRYESETAALFTPYYQECACAGAVEDRRKKAHDADQKSAAEKQRRHMEKVDKLLQHSGIRGRYLDKSFDTFKIEKDTEKAFKSVLRYVEKFEEMCNRGMGLYLSGSCGIGKTHLAVGIAQALIEQEYRVICRPSVAMLLDIKSTYDENQTRSEYELLREYLRADLLVIDDLGKELITDWSLSMLYTIVNMRYEDKRPIIITTNYDDAGLIDRLGRKGDRITAEALVSRLHEMSYAIPMQGTDYRGN